MRVSLIEWNPLVLFLFVERKEKCIIPKPQI